MEASTVADAQQFGQSGRDAALFHWRNSTAEGHGMQFGRFSGRSTSQKISKSNSIFYVLGKRSYESFWSMHNKFWECERQFGSWLTETSRQQHFNQNKPPEQKIRGWNQWATGVVGGSSDCCLFESEKQNG
jgi:hypothetical protein